MTPKIEKFIRRIQGLMDTNHACVIAVKANEEQQLKADVIYVSFMVSFTEATQKKTEHFIKELIIPVNGYPSYVVNLIYEMCVRRKGTIKFFDDTDMARVYVESKRRELHEWSN